MSASSPRPRRRWGRYLSVLAVVGVALILANGCAAFGSRARGERRERMARSPQWDGDHFDNPQPLYNDAWGMITGLFNASPDGSPSEPVPVQVVDPALLKEGPTSGLRVTWLGHSTLLIELDGHVLLTDPVWGPRTSPFTWVGPERWYPPLIALVDLPPIDAVILSHDHYDHLDYPTMSAMKDWDTTFVAPLGVGAHLAGWGIPESNIVEMDWWEQTKVKGLEITCTPARHASGRTGLDTNATLWASYALVGPRHRVYFSGDTGLFPAMKEIGSRLGPFDLTLIESGAYNQAWPDWHLGPEQAVKAHTWVQGRVLIPIHWGLFNLAYHAWTEPAERVLAEAERLGVEVRIPMPGQSIEPGVSPPLQRWWPEVPWVRGADDPIIATQVE